MRSGKRKIKENPIFEKYRGINRALGAGERIYLDTSTECSGDRYSTLKQDSTRLLHTPGLAVYVGAGASHSWLWFVDMLENLGFSDIIFLSEENIVPDLEDRDALLVSGGETFALAHGLGDKGKRAINSLLKRGGLYFGSCAGACMMMRSTTEPLGLFDIVNIKIANIVDELPEQIKPSNKFSSPYGCAFVFHPVREEVVLESAGNAPLYLKGPFVAPLYGGPPMEESHEVTILAKYHSFNEKTDYLAAPEKAEEILLGKTAICMKRHEEGHIILSGPHLEHPSFHEANSMIADSIFYSLAKGHNGDKRRESACALNINLLRDIKREISNLRITALGLEHSAISWLIGRKYYEPEKIRTYAEALWQRILLLEKEYSENKFTADIALLESSLENSRKALESIRLLKNQVNENVPSDSTATELFNALRPLSKDFFTYYFSRIGQLSKT